MAAGPLLPCPGRRHASRGCPESASLQLACEAPWGCRYHYNVSSARLDTHIGYGSRDKLTISSLASYQNMWAVVMDCDPQVRGSSPDLGASCPAEADAACPGCTWGMSACAGQHRLT